MTSRSESLDSTPIPRPRHPQRRELWVAGSTVGATTGVDADVHAAVLAALDDGLIVVDREGTLLQANAAASAILGVDLDAGASRGSWCTGLAARRADDGGPLDVGQLVLQSGEEARGVEVEVTLAGERVLLSVNYLPLRRDSTAIEGLVLSFRDVTDRQAGERTLLAVQERLREAHDVARLASWEWEPETGDVIVAQALGDSAISPGARIGLSQWLTMITVEQQRDVNDDFAAFVAGEREESVRRLRQALPGGSIWLEIRSRAVRDSTGRLLCVRGTAQDVSEQESTQQQLTTTRDFLQATLDSLATHVAVLDADGEIVMINRAWRDFGVMNGAVPGAGGVGSNYLDACDAAQDDETAALAAAGLRAIAGETEMEFSMEYPCHSPDLERWFELRATRYEGTGPTQVVVTHTNISEQKVEERLVAVDLDKLAWVARIEKALTQDGFVLHAQPILDIASGEIVQGELLLRMTDVDGRSPSELIPPAQFLGVAEEFGLITEIDRWVIDRATDIAATGLPVELNVSGRSVSDPRLVDYIKGAIDRTGADPQTMVFEITETTLVGDDVAGRAFVSRLHDLGCKIALDDFGTGYGGFTYLKQLPIDFLKIDLEFVRDLLFTPASRTVVQAIVRLARGFGLKTIAEGVENQETLDTLRDLGVDYAQGYHIGRPKPLRIR